MYIQISLPSNTDVPTLAKICTMETLWGKRKRKKEPIQVTRDMAHFTVP